MPFIEISTSAPTPSSAVRSALLSDVSKQAAEVLGKPEAVMMVRLSGDESMRFAGSSEPCCFISVQLIGAPTGDKAATLCTTLTELASDALKVPVARVFVVYTDVPGHHWGAGGRLLG